MIPEREVRQELGHMGQDWDRPGERPGRHPSRAVGDAYATRFVAAIRLGLPLVDARESALMEAERVRKASTGSAGGGPGRS